MLPMLILMILIGHHQLNQVADNMDKGDIAYSYTYENGQSYTILVRDGQVIATSNIFTTNQAGLIGNGMLGKYK